MDVFATWRFPQFFLDVWCGWTESADEVEKNGSIITIRGRISPPSYLCGRGILKLSNNSPEVLKFDDEAELI